MTLFEKYLIFINIISFILFGLDKWKAKHNKWRISILSLFSFSIVGGSLGGILGMYLFRHKTQQTSFKIGLPMIFTAQVFVLAYINFKIMGAL